MHGSQGWIKFQFGSTQGLFRVDTRQCHRKHLGVEAISGLEIG